MSDRPARRAAADAYDAMIAADHPLCRGATDAELADPIGTIDPARWMGPIAGRRVLCLAAGGGRHSVLYAAAGADVTVVDISPGMLDGDRRELSRRGLTGVRLIRGDMTDLSTLADASFDLVVQPVSTCYVPDVRPVYREVARVLRGDGIYVSQHKTPTNLQTSLRCNRRNRYEIEHPYREGIRIETADRGPAASRLRESGAIEFLHRWDHLLGGLCQSGFVITDVTEPEHHVPDAAAGTFEHRAGSIAPYVRIRAVRNGGGSILMSP